MICSIKEPDFCQCPDTISIGDHELACRCCGMMFELETFDAQKHYQETHNG